MNPQDHHDHDLDAALWEAAKTKEDTPDGVIVLVMGTRHGKVYDFVCKAMEGLDINHVMRESSRRSL